MNELVIVSSFFERFNSLLKEKQLKQIDISKMTGITPVTMSHYANGKREPNNVNTFLIAKCLDVNPMWLLGFDVPKEPQGKIQEKGYILYGEFQDLDEKQKKIFLENLFNDLIKK